MKNDLYLVGKGVNRKLMNDVKSVATTSKCLYSLGFDGNVTKF